MLNQQAIGPWLFCGTCGSKVGRGEVLVGWVELQCKQSKCKALTVFGGTEESVYVSDGRGGLTAFSGVK